jgi:hypothetical protein
MDTDMGVCVVVATFVVEAGETVDVIVAGLDAGSPVETSDLILQLENNKLMATAISRTFMNAFFTLIILSLL